MGMVALIVIKSQGTKINNMLKNLLNQSELNTYKIIQSKLQASGFYINVQTKLSSIFLKDSSTLSISEQKYLASDSSFDFVVFDSDAQPIFAVEFDGPSHEQYDKKIKNDIKKNSICSKMNFPLLRINDIHLKEQEGICLLEFIVDRFIKWQTEGNLIIDEIKEYLSSISEEERNSLTESGTLDPSVDPSFIFNINNPFPGKQIVAERLLKNNRIFSEFLPSEKQKEAKVRCMISLAKSTSKSNSITIECGCHVFVKATYFTKYKVINNRIVSDDLLMLYEDEVEFTIKWTLPIVQDYNPNEETPIEYLIKKGRLPISFQEIPGIHITYIAEEFCEYLGLIKIEEWAKENMATVLMGESKSK